MLGSVVEKYTGQFGHWINWSAWFKIYGQSDCHIYKAVVSIDICDTVDPMDLNINVTCSGDILWMFILQVTDVVLLYYRTEAVQH